MMKTEVTAWTDRFCRTFSRYASGDEPAEEAPRLLFEAGYCWHFAHMLQNVFGRGEVCWAAPFSHFVWMDEDGTAYDAGGFYDGEGFWFIPESELADDLLDGFRHVPGKPGREATKEELVRVMKQFCRKNRTPYSEAAEEFLAG